MCALRSHTSEDPDDDSITVASIEPTNEQSPVFAQPPLDTSRHPIVPANESKRSSQSRHSITPSLNSYPVEPPSRVEIVESCPYSPTTSRKSRRRSKSRNGKTEPPTDEVTQKRGRKRDRMYRLLPILLRRQSKKRTGKGNNDVREEGNLSDGELPRSGTWVQRGTPTGLQKPLETATLGRVTYTKKSDVDKMRRAPLMISTGGTLDSGIYTETEQNEPITQPVVESRCSSLYASATDAVAMPKVKKRISVKPQRLPQCFSVACQNGVCSESKATEIDDSLPPIGCQAEPQVQTFGKKMQVGKSFTAVEPEVESTGASHVYANIEPNPVYEPILSEPSTRQPATSMATALVEASAPEEVYDIGIQVGLPNRLTALRCRLEFEQPGVELGEKPDLMCQALDEVTTATLEEGSSDHDEKTLSFRVAFNNISSRCASTL